MKAPEIYYMSPFFVLIGFGERLDDYHILLASMPAVWGLVIALEVCRLVLSLRPFVLQCFYEVLEFVVDLLSSCLQGLGNV